MDQPCRKQERKRLDRTALPEAQEHHIDGDLIDTSNCRHERGSERKVGSTDLNMQNT